MTENKPALCEPGMKYFLKGSLKECKRFRDAHYTLLFNILATITFISIIGGFLWYRYKGKLTPEEKQQKMRKTHSYLISKLQQYSAIQNKAKPGMITNLPVWNRNMT
tara:strand:- start:554 stop:874 length:321 start_codon:yes stop_codon:yes gene_type:complete